MVIKYGASQDPGKIINTGDAEVYASQSCNKANCGDDQISQTQPTANAIKFQANFSHEQGLTNLKILKSQL